jgi:hypothetical protein
LLDIDFSATDFPNDVVADDGLTGLIGYGLAVDSPNDEMLIYGYPINQCPVEATV